MHRQEERLGISTSSLRARVVTLGPSLIDGLIICNAYHTHPSLGG